MTPTPESQQAALKPCPFCGSKARTVGYYRRYGGDAGVRGKDDDVRCSNHDCTLGAWSTPVVQWNTRTPAPVDHAALGRRVLTADDVDGSPDQHFRAHPAGGVDTRSCTCHPGEAPVPCQRKFALSECLRAAGIGAGVVPEGWKLVPEEPDDAMIEAAYEESMNHLSGGHADIYRAMLAAAPPHEKGQ